MTSKEASLYAAMQKLILQQNKMEDGFKKTGKKGKGAADTLAKAFNPMVLVQYAAGAMGVSAAIGAVTRALQEEISVHDQAAERIKGAQGGIKSLIQNATSKEQLDLSIAQAKRISVSEGLDIDTAAEMVAQTIANDVNDQLDTLAKTARFSTDPKALIESYGTFQAAFGKEMIGSAEQALSLFEAGARESPVTMEKIAPIAARAATAVSGIGGTPAETLASSSILAKIYGAEEGTVRVRALARAMGERDSGLTAQGLLPRVRELAAMPEEQRANILTESRAAEGFASIMQNLPDIERIAAYTAEAGKTGAGYAKKLEMAAGTQLLAGPLAEAQSKRAMELAEEPAGMRGLQYQAAMSELTNTQRQYNEKLGGSTLDAVTSWMDRKEVGFRRTVFGEENAIEYAQRATDTIRTEGLGIGGAPRGWINGQRIGDSPATDDMLAKMDAQIDVQKQTLAAVKGPVKPPTNPHQEE